MGRKPQPVAEQSVRGLGLSTRRDGHGAFSRLRLRNAAQADSDVSLSTGNASQRSVQAASNGPAHILLPVQFSHCLVVVNGAPARLTRANLLQTLVSFEGTLDARLEFHFGLFADNKCRLRDGLDNKALGL